MNLDLTPEPDEIVQAEEEPYVVQPIPVVQCGPVQVRELPGIRAGYGTETGVGTTIGVRLLPLEPRRKEAIIMALDQDIWISGSQSGAASGAAGAFRVTANVPFVIPHMDQVWAVSVTSTTSISVMSTYWSE